MQDYRIWRVEREADLAALRGPWTAMLAEAGQVPVFLTWEWVYTSRQHAAPPGQLWLLTAWDDEDELAGVAPLMLAADRRGPLRVRRLSFLGSHCGASMHQDFAARSWDRQAVLAALVSYLLEADEDWDVLDLAGLAASSLLGSCLADGPGWLLTCDRVPAPYLALPATWDDFAAEQLGPGQCAQLRRWQDELSRAYPGQVHFRRVTEACELPDALVRLEAFPADAPAGRAAARMPATQRPRAPAPAFAELALRHSWLHLYLLEIAGELAAAACNFLYRGVFTSYGQGSSPHWAQHHAGALLRAYTIEQAIAFGAREFDLLPGFSGHHAAWSRAARLDRHLMLSTGWPGHAWLWRNAAVSAARRLVAPR